MTKNRSHGFIYAEGVFKDLVSFDGNIIILDVSVNIDFALKMEETLKMPLNIRYVDNNLCCPVCGNKLKEHSTRSRSINGREVTLQRYSCAGKGGCGKYVDANLDSFIGKWQHYTSEVQQFGLNENLIDYSSLEKISEKARDVFGIEISRSTILNHMVKNADEFIEEKGEEVDKNTPFSGVVGWDEQFPFVNGEERARLMIIDTKTRRIIKDQVIDKKLLNKDYKKQFILENLQGMELKGIVSDGDKSYYDIIDNELQVPHSQCTFHIMKDLMDDNYKTIKKYNKKIESLENKINKQKGKIRKYEQKKKDFKKKGMKITKLNKEIKDCQKQIQSYLKDKREVKKDLEELKNYIERISNIFKCDKEENARQRFNILYNSVKFLPSTIAPFIKRLHSYFDRAIAHIKHSFLDSTNNVLERCFGVTLPGYLKKRYRTDKGLEIRIKLSNIRYTQRNLKNTPKILN